MKRSLFFCLRDLPCPAFPPFPLSRNSPCSRPLSIRVSSEQAAMFSFPLLYAFRWTFLFWIEGVNSSAFCSDLFPCGCQPVSCPLRLSSLPSLSSLVGLSLRYVPFFPSASLLYSMSAQRPVPNTVEAMFPPFLSSTRTFRCVFFEPQASGPIYLRQCPLRVSEPFPSLLKCRFSFWSMMFDRSFSPDGVLLWDPMQ